MSILRLTIKETEELEKEIKYVSKILMNDNSKQVSTEGDLSEPFRNVLDEESELD